MPDSMKTPDQPSPLRYFASRDVFIVRDADGHDWCHAFSEAFAALIVQAVNQHAELQASLEAHRVAFSDTWRRAQAAEAQHAALLAAAEMLWVVLANVSGGDWTKQSDEWQEAAARWRDNYFAIKPPYPGGEVIQP